MSASSSASKCLDLARNNADWRARCLRLTDSLIGDAGSHRCSMTACCSARLQGHNERRPELHVPSLHAAFATRPSVARASPAFPQLRLGWRKMSAPAPQSPLPEICVRASPQKARVAACQARRDRSHHVRPARKKGLRLKLNCHNPTSSTKPRKQGCSMKHDPSSFSSRHRR
jgi:hypothetical protein